MKPKYLFCIAALITLTLCGCSKNSDQTKYIDAEQTKQPNANAAGVTAEEPASASDKNTPDSRISAETAKELALAQVPGASETDILEFETDYDDGHTEYEGKIIYNGMEYEFEIDAYSGAFRSWETEPVD